MKFIHLSKHVIARVSSTLIDDYDDEPLPSGPTRLMLMIINNLFFLNGVSATIFFKNDVFLRTQ